jgi:hypothetical protein
VVRSALGFLLCVTSVAAGAQDVRAVGRVSIVGLTASGFIGPYPDQNIGGIGGLLGLEQKLSDGISVRALASVQRGFSGDDVTICRPDGLDGCLAIRLPYWLSSVEANAVVTPFPRFPLRFVAGLGYAIASDARGKGSGDSESSLPRETGLVIRRGLEIPLGSSARAPRLQYSRSDIRPQPFSLSRVEAVTILISR